MTAAVHENLTRDEAATRAGLVTVQSYDAALDLTLGDEVFGSTTTVRFTATPGATTFLDCTAVEVLSVTCNGNDLDLDEVVAPTRITLPDLAADNTVVVAGRMRTLREGRGMHHFRDPSDGRVYLHTQFEPFDAHQVVACFDQPDLKAPVTFRVTTPADWVVVSNAPVATAPVDGEAGEWVFEPTARLSPYVWAVVAGEYASVHDRHGDIDLGLYVRQSLREHLDPDQLFEETKQGFDWFNANFGIPYPFGKYDQLFVPEFSAGAMENPACVTFSENYLFRGAVTDAQRERRAETILHEMAHMWFGDLVTMRWWDDLWLNESFASFSAVLSQVEGTRYTSAWVTFLDEMKAWAKYQDQLPSTHPIAADMVDIESVHQNFDGITYAKGASVLRQLVAWVGQEEFLAGVREYFATHQYGNAELADFLRALEASSGRDLGPWRDAWLTTTGVNTVAVEAAIDDDNRFSSFVVVQSADPDHPTIRPHRLAIGIYDDVDGALVRTQRVEVDVTDERVAVDELVGQDAGVLVLPNDDDLTYAKVALDEPSLATAIDRLSTIPDPMARTLLWSSAWDMVRDGHLPAARYVDLVEAHVAHEDQIGVLTRLAQRAHGAAARYAAPAHAEDLLARLCDQAMHELEAASGGSDHQLAWARQVAATATTPMQLEVVADLRSGARTHDGLAIDQDLRWRLTVALARGGAVDRADIDDERAQDPTDFGQRQAATARAALPEAAAKQEAWDQLVDDLDLGQTMARQLWGGFQQLTQPEVLAAWVDPYFEALDTVWSTRSTEWAIEFANGMFPHAAASPEVLATATAARDRDDLPGPLRRVLAEQVDTLERTLRARAVDAAAGPTPG